MTVQEIIQKAKDEGRYEWTAEDMDASNEHMAMYDLGVSDGRAGDFSPKGYKTRLRISENG